ATPYSALIYEEQASAELLLTKKIRGNANYRSIFFTRKDSGISSLDQLLNKVIAFEKPGSTSAYFLPAADILAQGYQLVELDGPLDRPPQGTIGYVFSGDEANSAIWVHKRIVAAAAFSDEDWNSSFNMPNAFRDDISVFHRTRSAPRSIEVVRGDLDERIKARLKAVLFEANNDPDAQVALQGYYRASDFAELSEPQFEALQYIRLAMQDFEKLVNPAVRANLPSAVE
ncbi:MAG: PhnD/SsuA/transferrin family substrate-binding protein, partial [Gammaproteobacteria bacterium]|nr:PhnD/SsuA/transferrin family substrate-binding protein [Gammaproteobacteria bacterium]